MLVTVYMHQSQALNFKREIVTVFGMYGKIDPMVITGYSASESTPLLTPLFTKLLPELVRRGVTALTLQFPACLEAFGKAIGKDLTKAAPCIHNSSLSDETKADYITMCEALVASGLKVEIKPFKVNKEDFAGYLRADAAAACALTQWGLGNKEPAFLIEDPKAINKLAVAKNPMLLDNNLVDIGANFDSNVVFTGTSDAPAKASKKNKHVVDALKDASHVYFLGNNARLRSYGKYSALVRYNVLILKEPLGYLDDVMEYQRKLTMDAHGYLTGAIFKLAALTSPKLSGLLAVGDFTRIGISPSGDMFSNAQQRADLSYVFNPPRMFYKVKKAYLHAYERLVAAKELIESPNGHPKTLSNASKDLYLTDVTEYFYVDVDGKPQFSKERDTKELYTKFSDVLYDAGTCSVKLMYQTSMPTFPEFKRLVKLNPRVYIATERREEHVLELSVIISTDLGICRYSCPEGGLKVLKTVSKANRA